MKKNVFIFALLMYSSSMLAYGQYQIQYDSEAARVLQLGRETRRGNWCSRAEAEAYWRGQSKFERDHSRIVGSDCPQMDRAPSPSETSRDRRNQAASPTRPASGNIDKVDREEFEREKNDLLRRLKGGAIEGLSFDGDKNDLLGRIRGDSSAGGDDIAIARAELETMTPAVKLDIKKTIAIQKSKPDPRCQAITRSLKIKAPPPPPMMFSEVRPGDVLLVAPKDNLSFDAWSGHYLRLFDKLSSWEWNSRASHTAICLKEIKGMKFFLDNLPAEGPRIKSEVQMMSQYGGRYIDIARPQREFDARELWDAAMELGVEQVNDDLKRLGNPFKKGTNYGLYGDDNMVCSEASRWALVQAGLEIAKTESPFKRLLGIYYGPANFYSDKEYFLITPLADLRKTEESK